MPRGILLAWHSFLGRTIFFMARSLRQSTLANLKIAFGSEKNDAELKKIGSDLFSNLSKTVTDYALLWRLKSREEFAKYFSFEGEENLVNALKKGKGAICLVPHTTGWEFSAIMPPILGYTTFAVSSKIHNPALNKLMIELRQSRGMRNITRDHCFDKLVEGLDNGECLILMIDQDGVVIKGEFLSFFGKIAYTPVGSSRLALETGAPVVPMYTVRTENNKYLFKILPEIPFEKTGDTARDITQNTQNHNDAIEAIVRQYPDQWLWIHDRWATTPESLQAYLEERRRYKEQLSQATK